MRAAVLRRHGAAPEFGEHPAPQRGPGEALIRVTAAPVNPLDLLCASGTSYFGEPALPYVPGTQGVGTVEEADGLQAGQRVWFSAAASFGSAALRSGVRSVLGYTNNALTDVQRAAALREILAHAAAGLLTADRETMPLAGAAGAWSRCGRAPHRRGVLIP